MIPFDGHDFGVVDVRIILPSTFEKRYPIPTLVLPDTRTVLSQDFVDTRSHDIVDTMSHTFVDIRDVIFWHAQSHA